MNNDLLRKYAMLSVKMGVNIQKDQILVINSPIECANFTRMIAEAAYKEGAKDVVISWDDELFSKIRFLNAPEEVFEEFPEWKKDFYTSYARKGAAFLSIAARDPELLKDVDPERIAKAQKTSSIALKEFRERTMGNKNAWSIISIPTKSWAKKVFNNLSEEDSVKKLWETIFRIVRVDTDSPIDAWMEHKNNLKVSLDFLNNNRFKYLKYRNSLGTDLIVELPEDHIWFGGADYTTEGVEFVANIPTEEVFTAPKKTGVNGTVVSTKPFNYNGNLIENFTITFKDGKVTDFDAKKGYEILKKLINTDKGSCYLGEVALVPHDSPISNSKILFYNTLFDENASCHLALGKAYPTCVKGGENMSIQELEKAGINDSLIHEDFMIGTGDMEIVGVTYDGKEIPVFENGNFAF